jgi:hypothetical protein
VQVICQSSAAGYLGKVVYQERTRYIIIIKAKNTATEQTQQQKAEGGF